MKKIIEGSQAIAEAVHLCRPAVVSAYPITPQTHIVEALALFKAEGKAKYEYVRAESEFAAASIVAGASAAGVRSYTATSSQGLLLMTEVLFNISGLRLPLVLTCANRALSAPINIWNDHQDAMTIRDAGWIMLFAEDNQEAVDLHLEAYRITEETKIPVMVCVDGFTLTHTFEPVDLPSQKQVDQFLPPYSPVLGEYLNVDCPKTFGAFASPKDYIKIREQLHFDLKESRQVIKKTFLIFRKIFKRGIKDTFSYTGPKKAETILIAMGSLLGTLKETVRQEKDKKTGILKINVFRPFPEKEIVSLLSKTKRVIVFDKSLSLGEEGILSGEIKRVCFNKIKAKIESYIVGLGGSDITMEMVKKIIHKKQASSFIYE